MAVMRESIPATWPAKPRLLIVSSRVEALVSLRRLLQDRLAIEAVSALPYLLLALAGEPPDVILLADAPGGGDGLADALLAHRLECPLLLLTELVPVRALAALDGVRVAGVFPLQRLDSLLRSLDCLLAVRSPSVSRPVTRALGTLIGGWPERGSVRELAVQVGVSDSHLSHRFRSELGVSVRGLLLEVRIEKAVRLLVETDYTVQRVARLSGFTDAPHLCRMLSRHLGRRPSEVRCERWRGLRHRP